MKEFIKYTIATVVGIILCGIIMAVMGIVSVAGIVASENMSSPIEDKSILHIKLDGQMEERSNETLMSILDDEGNQTFALEDALNALRKAKENEKILGVYLEAGALGATPAMATELRHAIQDFKESGKFVYAYGDVFTKSAYYICSAADKVYLNKIGMLDWSGLASQPIFFKDVLEKIGVKMQVFKVGTYKSAVEPFICSEMSDANREQVTSFLTNIWSNFQKEVAESRGMTVETLDALADSMTILSDPEMSLKNGLIDGLCYLNEVKSDLKKAAGLEEDDDLKLVPMADMAKAETLKDKTEDEIAVYYAYGEIVDKAKIPGMGSNEHQIEGKEMTKDLQKLRKDDDVKAVVIRVNSPGGSAFASEQIWKEVTLLKEKKPVVISMGGMAASGGYYISCGADLIMAEPTTLTGSIGIFGMIPDASELLTQKIGLKFDMVKTHEMSDFGAIYRPFNEGEASLMQAHVNKGYELFTGRVAEGRHMPQDDVKKIAEGRVWTGEQAMELGLVDKMGDLDDAILMAADLAQTEKYSVGCYPAPSPWYENILNKEKSSYLESEMRSVMGDYYTTFTRIRNLCHQHPIQARIMFDPNIQ